MTKAMQSMLERKELKEKNTMTLKDKALGDDRAQGVPDPHDPHDPHCGGAHGCMQKPRFSIWWTSCRCHPLDPLPPNPMDLLGNLVDALHDASLQANPGHRCRFQQAL